MPRDPETRFQASDPLRVNENSGDSESKPDVCPSCGTTRRDLYTDGRMGCADCYRVFQDEVTQALREIHGAVQHIGKA